MGNGGFQVDFDLIHNLTWSGVLKNSSWCLDRIFFFKKKKTKKPESLENSTCLNKGEITSILCAYVHIINLNAQVKVCKKYTFIFQI